MEPRALDSPLEGVKVVALEQAVAMPYCTFVLCELGADVTKIERPGTGDVIRGWDGAVRGISTGFVWLNANKQDIAIDVRNDAGRQVIRELAAEADVFVENFAPGVAGRLGLGPDELMEANSKLIYCSLSGYGQSGPYRDVKAYDLLVQGESGLLLTSGYPDAPVKIGIPITDLIAGSNAAIGIASALFQRGRTGRGAYIDVSMLDSALPWLSYYPHRHWHEGTEPPRTGLHHQYVVPYGPYVASDGGQINIVVASDDHWQRFCRLVGRMEWIDDPRMMSMAARSENREFAEAAIDEAIAERPVDVWMKDLAEAGLPCGRVRTVGQALAHPQVEARQMVATASSPVGEVPLVRFPLSQEDRPRHVPKLGEQTDAILQSLGYSLEAIGELRASGAVA